MNNLKNSVNLIGHLGNDPEIKRFDDGKVLAQLSIATNEYYLDKKGEKVSNTTWHRAIAWGETAKNIEQHLKKGNEVAIEGKLTTRSYEDKKGTTQTTTQVNVNSFLRLTKVDTK